ncbi:oligosaccharide flippase family protein [Senegalia sp. (in: firmicutes)]|uniref:oligosaccharide flippase family protein n=1 Tax=Senegalia sp. (in: firmicutes) TaxID=1924098 RepID=UPI003F991DC3
MYSKNIASNLITRIIKIALSMIVSIAVARTLGPEKKGYIAYFVLVTGLIATYSQLGITNASSYFQKRSSYPSQIVFNVNMSFLLIISTIITIIIIGLRSFDIIFVKYTSYIIFSGVIFIILSLTSNLMKTFYIANERIRETNKVLLIANAIKIALVLVLWPLNLLNSTTYYSAIVLEIILITILLTKNLNINFKFQLDKVLLTSEFKYGIFGYFSGLFMFLNYRVDQLVIKQTLTLGDLGIYSIAVSLAEMVFLVPTSIEQALMGKLYTLKKGDLNTKLIVSTTFKFTFYVCIILVIIGSFMTPLIPVLYGSAYAEAKTSVLILFIGTIFASVAKVSATYFFTEGKPQVQFYATLITLLMNIVLNYKFIPIYGIHGAAIASTGAYFIYGTFYVIYFTIIGNFKFKDLFILNKSDKEIISKFTNDLKNKISKKK